MQVHAADTPSQLVASKQWDVADVQAVVQADVVQLHHHAVAKSLLILADAVLLPRSAACWAKSSARRAEAAADVQVHVSQLVASKSWDAAADVLADATLSQLVASKLLADATKL